MAEVPTVEIHSPKDASQKWIINHDDYKPGEHRLWNEPVPAVVVADSVQVIVNDSHVTPDEPDWIDSGPGAGEFSPPDEPDWIDSSGGRLTHAVTPSHPDFVSGDDGEVIAVNIIDPDRRTSRKEIHISTYDPDKHELWSSHPRFNK